MAKQLKPGEDGEPADGTLTWIIRLGKAGDLL